MKRQVVLVMIVALVGCGPEIEAVDACASTPVIGVWEQSTTITIVPDSDLIEPTRAAAASWRPSLTPLGLILDVEDAAQFFTPNLVRWGETSPGPRAAETVRTYRRDGAVHHLASFAIVLNGNARGREEPILVHELGHALGLEHSASMSDAMYCDVFGYDAPQPGDLAALSRAYAAR